MVAPLMFPGELALVTAEHTFGYGVAGDGSRVPGSSDLELEVELLDWAELGAVPDMERASRLEIGMRKRERGNKHFTRGTTAPPSSATGKLPSILTINRLRT